MVTSVCTRAVCMFPIQEGRLLSMAPQLHLGQVQSRVFPMSTFSQKMATVPNDISGCLKDLTISSSEIQSTDESVGREIGHGAYTRVFTVKHAGSVCAAKEIHSFLVEGVGEQQIREGILRECQHCSVLNHSNIVRFIGISNLHSTVTIMIMELMDQSLYDYINSLPKYDYGSDDYVRQWRKNRSILIDVAKGLVYLHEQKPAIVHGDLSTKNILLKMGKGEVPVAKIADLGVARIIKTDSKATQSMLKQVPGSVDFMPPESLGDKPVYGTPTDTFSYGAIMLFVITHKWPTPSGQANDDDSVAKESEVEHRQKYIDEIKDPEALLKRRLEIIKSCLRDDPSERPTMAAVLDEMMVSSLC